MKQGSIKSLKKYLLFGVVIIVLIWVAFAFIGQYKIRSAQKKYLNDYVKVVNSEFNKYKQNAVISATIQNFGRRLLDSVVVKIEYYDDEGKLLDSDKTDVLKTAKDFLYPEAGKVFRIDVTCPEETAEIKLDIE